MKMIAFAAGAAFASLSAPVEPAHAQSMRPALAAASAKAIVSGCEAMALEKGWALNIAVLDQGRNLVAFLRMDDAPLGSIEVSQWKANAAASFPTATKNWQARAEEFPALAAAPNIAVFEGGEAIFTTGGEHIGGVGVSGAAGAQDAECARAGIEAAGLKYARPD